MNIINEQNNAHDDINGGSIDRERHILFTRKATSRLYVTCHTQSCPRK